MLQAFLAGRDRRGLLRPLTIPGIILIGLVLIPLLIICALFPDDTCDRPSAAPPA